MEMNGNEGIWRNMKTNEDKVIKANEELKEDGK